MKRKIVIAIIHSILLITILFQVQYLIAKKNAIDYLNIINANSVQYEYVKNKIQDIVSEETKALLFSSNVYANSKYAVWPYKVHSIKGIILGYNDYKFIVEWTSFRPRKTDSISAIIITDGKITDAYRVDD